MVLPYSQFRLYLKRDRCSFIKVDVPLASSHTEGTVDRLSLIPLHFCMKF